MQDASLGWGQPDSGAPPLLSGVGFMVEKGQRVLMLGPNGAGKTTLLKAVSGQGSTAMLQGHRTQVNRPTTN